MSYLVFLLIALSVTAFLAAAAAGPLSGLFVLGFWIAHYFFVNWKLYREPLHSMSDTQLDALLSDWTRGLYWHSVTHISAVRRRNNNLETEKALKRLVAIYEELIRRAENTDNDIQRVNNFRRQLENHKNELKYYSSPSSSDGAAPSATVWWTPTSRQ